MSFYYLQAQIVRPFDITSLIPRGFIESVTSSAGGFIEKQVEGQVENISRQVEGQIEEQIGEQLGGQGVSLRGLPSEILRMIPQGIRNLIPGLGGEGPALQTPGEGESDSIQAPPSGEGEGIINVAGMAEDISSTVIERIEEFVEPFRPFIPYVPLIIIILYH